MRRWPFVAGRAEVLRFGACALLAGLLASSCGFGASPSARSSLPSPASQAAYLTYGDSTYGFRIKYPPAWSEEVGTAGSVVAFLSPQQGGSDDFRDNLNVLVQDLPDPSTPLSEYTRLSLRQAPQIIDGFKLLTSGPSTLASRSAWRVTYLGQSGNHDLEFEAFWLVEKGRAYVLTFTAARAAFDAFEPTTEAMIDSFQLG